jgi:hypothetical protein
MVREPDRFDNTLSSERPGKTNTLFSKYRGNDNAAVVRFNGQEIENVSESTIAHDAIDGSDSGDQ